MTDYDDLEALFITEYPRLARALGADAAQAAFVQAYLKWRRVRQYDDPAAWVRRVAANRRRNEDRGRRRQRAVVDRLAQQPSPADGSAPRR